MAENDNVEKGFEESFDLNAENPEKTIQEKLSNINKERDERLAEIEKGSSTATVPPVEPQATTSEPDLPSIKEYTVNTEQDEVDKLLTELFEYAVYHPEASPENTFPFVRVMLKERAINLANSISAVENGDDNTAAGLERVMGTLKGIWDTFQLENNQTRQHLISAVNSRIAELHEKPKILRHKLSIVEKAVLCLEQNYNVPNAKRYTFGAGLL